MTTNTLAAIRERADEYEIDPRNYRDDIETLLAIVDEQAEEIRLFEAMKRGVTVRIQDMADDRAALLAIVDALTARAEAAEAALEGAIGMLEAIANNAPDDHTPPVEQWKWKFWVAGQGAMVQAAALRKIAADALAAHDANGESAGNGGA